MHDRRCDIDRRLPCQRVRYEIGHFDTTASHHPPHGIRVSRQLRPRRHSSVHEFLAGRIMQHRSDDLSAQQFARLVVERFEVAGLQCPRVRQSEHQRL